MGENIRRSWKGGNKKRRRAQGQGDKEEKRNEGKERVECHTKKK